MSGPAVSSQDEWSGKFSEATLLFLFCVSGDGWKDDVSASDQRRNRYKMWRGTNNEDRRLYEAPGHRFGPHQVSQLSRAIELALELGWAALLAAKPGRPLLLLWHDDRLEIYRSSKGRALVARLKTLRYWRG
jgi:hypothetical protein